MYKRMLVPLDGSELAEVVFGYARELAGRLDLDIILLHVCRPREHDLLPMHRAYIEHAADILRHQSVEVQQKTRSKPGGKAVQARGEVVEGYPAEEILSYADKNNVDLILLASHGHSGVRRWALGGVADKVLRASKVPIWLARAAIPEAIVHDKWPQRTMLVPLDGSQHAESVLPHVEALAKQRGTELVEVVLLRVYEPPINFLSYSSALCMPLDWDVEKETLLAKRECEQYLDGVQKHLSDVGLRVRSEVLLGKPIDEIIDYTSRNPFNLVVLATHGRSGITRWSYGQVAVQVLQRSTSPVFLVRPQKNQAYGVTIAEEPEMTEQKNTNITWHQPLVSRADREKRNGHRGAVVWITGLPSSGKSSLAHEVERRLFELGCNSYVLDGDNIRHRLNKDLGFSPEDRTENIRRIGEVANLFTEAGVIVLTAFISPYQEDRDQARALNEPGSFFEVFCKCSIDECERRDPKGLYSRARKGEITEFTGVSAPYEEPCNPEIVVEADKYNLKECADQILQYLEQKGVIHIVGKVTTPGG